MNCDFIGIGVQKGASTWVYKVLEDHPEVKVSFPKELNFFSVEKNFAKGIEWYHSFFEEKDSNPVLYGEISPSYFHHDGSPKRAFDYNPSLKIIVTLRDPVERAYSNHLHVIRRNMVEYLGENNSFEAGLQKCMEVEKGHPQSINQSHYYRHLKKWFEVFPRENILVLIKEDIEKNPSQNVKKLYKFLEIDDSHLSFSLYRRPNSSNFVKFSLLESLLRKGSKLAVNLGLGGIVPKLKNNSFVIRLREDKKTHLCDVVPPMLLETKQSLMDEFSTDVIQLAELLEVDSLPWDSWEYAVSKK